MNLPAHLAMDVRGVRKRYRLGSTSSTTLSEDLSALLARLMGRPDPRLSVGPDTGGQRKGREFWALQGVDFELRKGEVLGIIGRNGAGKSTLLKLLSRITLPTEGTIRLRGRVSSLLEVGTGFNPELTGRENIFLNGTILGMRKAEVSAKLDEIIDFSGIEHHIDSPVKRYSSGMKVRLGFAVAAHLEPDILIVDEVLAVGDADFQRKCLGKMKDVSLTDRTILFVSHNMTAVRSLCSRAIWLQNGQVRLDGPTDEVVGKYLGTYTDLAPERIWQTGTAPGNEFVQLVSMGLDTAAPEGAITQFDDFRIVLRFNNLGVDDGDLNVVLWVYNSEDILVFTSGWKDWAPNDPSMPRGLQTLRCHVPGYLLNTGEYRVVLHVFRSARVMFSVEETIAFEIHDGKRAGSWFGKHKGVVRPKLEWQHSA